MSRHALKAEGSSDRLANAGGAAEGGEVGPPDFSGCRGNRRSRRMRTSGGRSGGFFVRGKSFGLSVLGGAGVVGVIAVVFVDDGVYHDGLFVDCEDGVGRHGNPRFWF